MNFLKDALPFAGLGLAPYRLRVVAVLSASRESDDATIISITHFTINRQR
jgi:hypothetical protein